MLRSEAVFWIGGGERAVGDHGSLAHSVAESGYRFDVFGSPAPEIVSHGHIHMRKPWKNELHVFPPFPQPLLLLTISSNKNNR